MQKYKITIERLRKEVADKTNVYEKTIEQQRMDVDQTKKENEQLKNENLALARIIWELWAEIEELEEQKGQENSDLSVEETDLVQKSIWEEEKKIDYPQEEVKKEIPTFDPAKCGKGMEILNSGKSVKNTCDDHCCVLVKEEI